MLNMSAWRPLKSFKPIDEDDMNIYEDEEYEIKMDRITDRMAYLILDLISMAIEKLEHENQIYEEFLQARLETKNDF
jgi:cupin superfamily acireductone dioxygenase involved in methionine salvage